MFLSRKRDKLLDSACSNLNQTSISKELIFQILLKNKAKMQEFTV